jgi:type I restriction enzyme R subunit
MGMTPEQKARVSIDALLQQAGWHVCDVSSANIHAATCVAIREFPLNSGFGFADYLLYVNGKAFSVIEAKKVGLSQTTLETLSGRYFQGPLCSKSGDLWCCAAQVLWTKQVLRQGAIST